MLQYAEQNGVPGDEWGSCYGIDHCYPWSEQNETLQVSSWLMPSIKNNN